MLRIPAVLAMLARSSFELGYHRDLSREATTELSADARRLIINANLFVDIRSALLGLARRRHHSLSRKHFDDCFGWSAFRQRWRETEGPLLDGSASSPERLARAIGEALHTGQDYYAHSNHVESLTAHHPKAFRPVTYETVMTDPGWAALKEQWAADTSGNVATSLLSGAYFTVPPCVADDRGEPQELHHRTLHKDQPNVRGQYLYRDFDRTAMHFRARACASLESERLMRLADQAHPEEFSALRRYQSSPGERLWETIRYWFAIGAGMAAGHWR